MVDDSRTLRRDLGKIQQVAKQLATTVTNQAEAIAALATALAAVNAKTQRTGAAVGGLAVGNVDVAITWPNTWPDTLYGVIINITSGTGALGSLDATLKAGTKTIDGCVVTVANTGASAVGAFGLDVVGIRT